MASNTQEGIVSNFLRSMAARGYQIKPISAKYAMQKYKHLIYRGDECIGQFKLKQDAEAAMAALIEVDYQKLVSEISREPVIDVRPSS